MKSLKSASYLALSALATASMVVANAPIASAKSNVTNITFWHYWSGPEGKSMQKLVDQFNKTHPTIHVQALGSQTAQKELTAMTGGQAPDVAYAYYPDVEKWASVGAVTPLDSYIKATNFNTKDQVKAAWSLGTYQSQQYGIPYTMDVYMLFYNKDLFKKAGITHPPRTISELKQDAWKLTKPGPNGYKQVGFIPDFPWLDQLDWRYVFGASLFNTATKKVTANSPQNIASLNFERSFYQAPYDKTKMKKFESGFGKYMSPNNAFFQGQLAMDVDGEWYPTFIKEFSPKLNYGVAPLPYPDGHPELAGSASLFPGMLYIPAGSQHKDAAWTFISWLESKAPYTAFCGDKGSLPTTLSSLRDPNLLKLNPGMKPFLSYAAGKNIKGFPSVSFINEYFNALTTEDTKVLNLEESPQQAMQNVTKQIQPLANK